MINTLHHTILSIKKLPALLLALLLFSSTYAVAYENGITSTSSEEKPFSGKLIEYHDNGNKKLEEHWELTGRAWPSLNRKTYKATYYANGHKASETIYESGFNKETNWHENGNKASETTYESGFKHGVETYWYKNGKKEIQRNFQNGIKVGNETKWYENGNKAIETNWKGSSKSFETLYYNNGQKESEVTYESRGKSNTKITWYETGQKKSKHIGKIGAYWYKDGQIKSTTEIKTNQSQLETTVETNYSENGQKITTFTYRHNKKEGYAAEYDKNGDLIKEYIYKNGIPEEIKWALFGVNNIDFFDQYFVPIIIIIIVIIPFFFIKTDPQVKSKRSAKDKLVFWLFFSLFLIPLTWGDIFIFFSLFSFVNYFSYYAFNNSKMTAAEIIWKYYARPLFAAFIIFAGCSVLFF